MDTGRHRGSLIVGALIVAAALAVTVGGCGSSTDDGTVGGSASSPLTIEQALVLGEADAVWVSGSLLAVGSDVRLCAALAESYPPQCAGPSLVVHGADVDGIVGLSRTTVASGAGPATWSEFPVLFGGSLSDGVLSVTEAPASLGEARGAGVTVRFDHSPRPLSTSGTVFWRLDVRNTAAVDLHLTFGSGQKGDVVVSAGDTEVYRWSRDKVFTEAIEQVALAPGEVLGVVLNDPVTLDPGDYEVRAWITGTFDQGAELPEIVGRVSVG